MKKRANMEKESNALGTQSRPIPAPCKASGAILGLAAALMLAGCGTPQPGGAYAEGVGKQAAMTNAASAAAEGLVLHEGDLVRVTFPGAPNLNTAQQIRRDGKVALPLVGEFKAAGLTPSAMEKELLQLYGTQLVTKEVTVAVESATYPVYVTGSVLKPGKLTYDRPVTALEALMEAGVDYSKANLKSVTVIRHVDGKVEQHKLNLKGVLQGRQGEPFALKPSDIVFVPEKFTWF